MSLVVSKNVEKYDDIYKKGHDKSYPNLDLVRLEGWYFKGDGGKVLDYGFGTGNNLIHMLRRGYSVTGAEASIEAVRLLERKLAAMPDLKSRATLVRIETKDELLPMKDESFDFIVCMSVLSLLETKDRIQTLVTEFQRVLKPGGKMIIDVNGPGSDFALKGKFVSDDLYEYILRDHHADGILCYCPQSKESFGRLFGTGWVVDDLGMVAFDYAGMHEFEWLACVRKA